MPPALELVRAFKQNLVGGAFEALAAGTGDTLAVRAYNPGSRAWLLEAWGANSANASDFDIRSPDMHDNVRGIRFAYAIQPSAGKVQRFLPGVLRQQLYPTDVLIAEVNGTATNNVGLNLLNYYEDLPGSDANLMSWAEINAAAVDMVGINVNAVAGAAGDWGATRALNADDDRLIANTWYAILGATSQLPAEACAITAPETSNRKVGLPLMTTEQDSGQWFVELSNRYQLPLIPVINANNKTGIQVQVADAAGATAAHVVLLLMELNLS